MKGWKDEKERRSMNRKANERIKKRLNSANEKKKKKCVWSMKL